MINVGAVTVEANYSTNYVENYLDSVENLPDDVQRHLSRIREIDVLYRSHLRDVNMYYEQWSLNQQQQQHQQQPVTAPSGAPKGSTNDAASSSTATATAAAPMATTATTATPTTEQSNTLKRVTSRIQKSLIAAQELGDEKLQIIQQLQDLIDHKTRQLDQDFVNLGNEFFVRVDYTRGDDKTLDGGRDVNGTSLTGVQGGNGSSNGSSQYGVTSNGMAGGPNGSGGYSVGSNGGNGGIGPNSHIMHTPNGTSGNGVGSALGGGNGSGMYGGNNGNGSFSSERSSKRARRTRNDQAGGSVNGSNTPNSMCGVSAMDVDPIEDIIGGSGGIGVGGVGSSGSGTGSGAGGNGGQPGSIAISGGNIGGPSVGGGIKQEMGSGGNGNGGNGGTTGSGSSHTSLSGSGPGQTQSVTLGGNGSKSGNGGNGGSLGLSSGSGSSGNGGNGSGASNVGVAASSTSQLNSSNQGSGKKGTGSGNNTGSGSGAGGANSGKKKKRKTGGRGSQATREAREDTPAAEETIDPDEPTYCLCDQISFGEMILCDNDLCPIEWFHFSCVSLISKPKGRWFCPNCRGDRPNVMKPKAQFLKELERYNKEKEEKT
uniref:Inhibitor of growth protein n=1 Tax=Anopheles epiroticus TaxID=199890 RepID=A0A182P2I9_9DIPT